LFGTSPIERSACSGYLISMTLFGCFGQKSNEQ
jgi:hypothetical protein